MLDFVVYRSTIVPIMHENTIKHKNLGFRGVLGGEGVEGAEKKFRLLKH